jgi:UDP-N-acetylmuramoyl-L-alanyl-D-glutamate--2,6-diaminopimelate ligase
MVADTRAILPRLASELYGQPSQLLPVIGVTGTNGKTTVTFLLEAIAHAAGLSCGLIGTVVTRLGDRYLTNPHTTPEAPDFQRLLAEMVAGGADWVATEVSSHALSLGRVEETEFAVGAFTNLSQDHLDLHGSMEQYFQAKASLFEQSRRRVVWVDDPYGKRLADSYPDALRVGWNEEVSASDIAHDAKGTSFTLKLPDGDAGVRLSIAGRFNVANALVAAGCAHVMQLDAETIARGMTALSAVPGRFEIVSADHPITVVVDYAHTPDGIATVINTARALGGIRVIALVGAGGDRDRSKRPAMGRAASSADLVIITSDNPRSENPQRIADEVLTGVDNPNVKTVLDRRAAIAEAIAAANGGDIVLILGKGHETGQERGGVISPFSDQEIARSVLAHREDAR